MDNYKKTTTITWNQILNMREIWTTIKTISLWIFGIAGILLGIISFFATYGIIPKVLGGLLLVIGVYIIPRINEKIDLGIKPKYILIAYLIGLLGIVLTFENNHEPQIKQNQYFVTAKKLNIRKGQGANYAVVYQLEEEDTVEVISKNGDWAEISTSKGTGYASTKYLSNEIPKKSNKSD